MAGGDHVPNLLGGAREHHGLGLRGVLGQPVRLVGAQLVRVGEHMVFTGDALQLGDQAHEEHCAQIRP